MYLIHVTLCQCIKFTLVKKHTHTNTQTGANKNIVISKADLVPTTNRDRAESDDIHSLSCMHSSYLFSVPFHTTQRTTTLFHVSLFLLCLALFILSLT